MGRGPLVGVGSVSAGYAFAALSSLLIMPLVAIWYGPEAFGLAAAVLLVAGVLGTMISGRYEVGAAVADHSPEGERESAALARLSLGLAVVSSLVIQAILVGWAVLNQSVDGAWLWLPALSLVSVAGSVQTLLDTRAGHYNAIGGIAAVRPLLLGVTAYLLSAGAGPAAGSSTSLCVAYFVSGLPAALRLVWLLLGTRSEGVMRCASVAELARIHSRYPRYQVPAALLNNLAFSAFGLVIGVMLGAASLGAFSLATRVTFVPVMIAGGPINTVYLREATLARGNRLRSRRYYLGAVGGSAAIGAASTVGILLLAPFMQDLLGDEWAGMTDFLGATIPLMLSQLVSGPPNSALMTRGEQRELMWWRVVLVCVPIGVLVVASWLGVSPALAILISACFSLSLSIVYAAYGLRRVSDGS